MFKIILLLFTPKRRGSPAPPAPSLTHSPRCPAELWDQTGAPQEPSPCSLPALPACASPAALPAPAQPGHRRGPLQQAAHIPHALPAESSAASLPTSPPPVAESPQALGFAQGWCVPWGGVPGGRQRWQTPGEDPNNLIVGK